MTKMRIYFFCKANCYREMEEGNWGKKVLIIATAIVYSVGNSHNFVLPAVSTNRMMYLSNSYDYKEKCVSQHLVFFRNTAN